MKISEILAKAASDAKKEAKLSVREKQVSVFEKQLTTAIEKDREEFETALYNVALSALKDGEKKFGVMILVSDAEDKPDNYNISKSDNELVISIGHKQAMVIPDHLRDALKSVLELEVAYKKKTSSAYDDRFHFEAEINL